MKDTDADGLVEAVRVISAFAAMPAPASPPVLKTLTPRERDVLACLGAGLSNMEIADRLGMAESTTKTHVSRILTKLGLRSRVQAAILAQDQGVRLRP